MNDNTSTTQSDLLPCPCPFCGIRPETQGFWMYSNIITLYDVKVLRDWPGWMNQGEWVNEDDESEQFSS